jgi:hypothetical protein
MLYIKAVSEFAIEYLTKGVFVELSLFLAKLFGIYFLIAFILLVTQKREMVQGIKSFVTNLPLLMFSGSISLLAGLAILIGHPVWTWGWPVVITLLGLFMLIRGICRLGFPALSSKHIQTCLGHKNCMAWITIITFVLGVFLTWRGFVIS